MKNTFFCLTMFFSLQMFGQRTLKDSIILRNDSVFIVKIQSIYEYVPDTTELHERYIQIESIISTFRDEQDLIKSKIEFFKEEKSLGFMQSKKTEKIIIQNKKPARKPKKSKQ
jgi:hypothetical protein